MNNTLISETIKQYSSMIDILRFYNGLDKQEIAKRLKVSVPTVYKITDELNQIGIVDKTSSFPIINSNYSVLVGISIGSAQCKVTFLHFDFKQFKNEEFIKLKKDICIQLSDIVGSDTLFKKSQIEDSNYIYYTTPNTFKDLKRTINGIFKSLKVFNDTMDNFNLCSIGISSTGVVNENEQFIKEAHNLNYLRDCTVENFISPEFRDYFNKHNIVVALIQNSNAAVIGERIALYQSSIQLKSYSNVVSIYLGVGIGAGFIIQNMYYPGKSGYAGEIGHTPAPSLGIPLNANISSNNKEVDNKCTCGSSSCYDYMIRTYVFNKTKKDFSILTSTDIYDYLKKHPEKQLLLGQYLGAMVNTITSILNPDIIIFTGKLKESMPLLQQYIDDTKDENQLKFSRNDTTSIVSTIGSLSPSIGAAIFSYYKKYNIPCAWYF